MAGTSRLNLALCAGAGHHSDVILYGFQWLSQRGFDTWGMCLAAFFLEDLMLPTAGTQTRAVP